MSKKLTREKICGTVSEGLRQFGYPGVTDAMIGEILDAFNAGKRFPDLPYGVIGGFAESQLAELSGHGVDLSQFTEAAK